MTVSQDLLDAILSALETRELRSLQWGFVDGAMAESELQTLIATHLGDDDPDAVDAVIIELKDRCLLFEFEGEEGEYQYRSRFAEGVRLLSRLKQLFPGRSWASAPDLVSDFRVQARPRAFPRREVPLADAIARLSALPGWTGAHLAAINALIPAEFRLAGFQVRATEAVLRKDPPGGGVVVCAGTGSGKTLAFYYPALIEIATLVRKDEFWTKAVALYPRVELLKDQFGEAYAQARRLDALMGQRGARPIRLGTFFSLTPGEATPRALEQAKWKKEPTGYVCPFLTCPCGKDLLWLHEDLAAGRKRLRCAKGAGCSGEVTDQEVALTRVDLKRSPPDILFTTTESLNQRLSDVSMRRAFGISPVRQKAVRLVLLDEIHTYSGTTGAQTALVMRRWRRLLPPDVRFIGLSATLENAPAFLSSLVGLDEERVQETSPLDGELEHKTMAYQLVLRGNPASQTQLLSTSIQASFLLARLMDGGLQEGQPGRSKGLIGQRTFVFTDDLDVTNRLYDMLRDAEAHDIFGNPDSKRDPLAALRAGDLDQPQQRRRVGQNWEIVEQISGSLSRRLKVTRTSSQDAGVDRQSDLVVASPSLEVGFDDPTVGAVLQHKSPHDMASFLQRKGRAGRTRVMRPWMVTVLSDFGRDRLTFQEYERLFDPVLKEQWLPIRNRYILRMQAAMTLLDWLSGKLPAGMTSTWVWRTLNGPSQYTGELQAQALLRDLLTRLLQGDTTLREDLERALRTALGVDDDDLQSVLWEPPRSLMLDAIPTLLRRINTEWQVHPALSPAGGPAVLDRVPGPGRFHPLPDFVPANLFSPLNVPDVTVRIPPATVRHDEREESMGIVQAMNQLVPGRVTRRFAPERGGLYHWVPVQLVEGEQTMSIAEYAQELETVTMLSVEVDGAPAEVTLYRPWAMQLRKVTEKEISPTSNATLNWQVSLVPPEEPTRLATDADARFRDLLAGGRFFLHQFRTPVTVRRFVLTASARPRLPGERSDLQVEVRFVDQAGAQAAVGFEQEVDGFCLDITLPATDALLQRLATAPSRAAWYVAFFHHRVATDSVLVARTTYFDREWLFQVFFSALTVRAVLDQVDLAEALRRVQQGDPHRAFAKVLDGIFQVDPNAPQDDEPDEDPDADARKHRPGLRDGLLDLLTTPEIFERLVELAGQITTPDPELLGPWLVDRLTESMAEVVLQACQRIAPRHIAPESLLVDYRPAPAGLPNTHELWVTEATTGGLGALEAVAAAAIGTPHALFSALEAALVPGDQEVVSQGLARFIDLVETVPAVAEAAAVVRASGDHARHAAAFANLRSVLSRHGLAVDASLAVALHQRILRQGTSADSDRLLADLLRYWTDLEERLGVTLDLRTFAYVAVSVPAFAGRITELFRTNTGEDLSPEVRVASLTGLLWAHPHEHRSRMLQSYSPFRRTGWTDPALVRELILSDRVTMVSYGENGWEEGLRSALETDATVRLQLRPDQEAAFQRDLVRLLAQPVTFQDLQFYPALERLERDGRHTVATLTIKEMI